MQNRVVHLGRLQKVNVLRGQRSLAPTQGCVALRLVFLTLFQLAHVFSVHKKNNNNNNNGYFTFAQRGLGMIMYYSRIYPNGHLPLTAICLMRLVCFWASAPQSIPVKINSYKQPPISYSH
jgi:hypothetical protein